MLSDIQLQRRIFLLVLLLGAVGPAFWWRVQTDWLGIALAGVAVSLTFYVGCYRAERFYRPQVTRADALARRNADLLAQSRVLWDHCLDLMADNARLTMQTERELGRRWNLEADVRAAQGKENRC